jgi:hypothetical protein
MEPQSLKIEEEHQERPTDEGEIKFVRLSSFPLLRKKQPLFREIKSHENP